MWMNRFIARQFSLLLCACSFGPPHTVYSYLFSRYISFHFFPILFSLSIAISLLSCSCTRCFNIWVCLRLSLLILACIHIHTPSVNANNLETVQWVDFIGVYCTYFCYDTNSQTLNSITIEQRKCGNNPDNEVSIAPYIKNIKRYMWWKFTHAPARHYLTFWIET